MSIACNRDFVVAPGDRTCSEEIESLRAALKQIAELHEGSTIWEAIAYRSGGAR